MLCEGARRVNGGEGQQGKDDGAKLVWSKQEGENKNRIPVYTIVSSHPILCAYRDLAFTCYTRYLRCSYSIDSRMYGVIDCL